MGATRELSRVGVPRSSIRFGIANGVSRLIATPPGTEYLYQTGPLRGTPCGTNCSAT